MPSTHRILVADADRTHSKRIADDLSSHGYLVTTVGDARGLHEALSNEAPALLVLDADLPDVKGTELLRDLRAAAGLAELPVLMTSARDDEIDRVVAFELGADDYQVKPLGLRELALRIRAILRRKTDPDEMPRLERCTLGPLEIDLARHRVTIDGDDVHLTPLELRLLTFLAMRAGRVETRETLLAEVWGLPADSETRAVDTTIKRLRKKLGRAEELVETVRGVGYRVRDVTRSARATPAGTVVRSTTAQRSAEQNTGIDARA